MNTQFDFNQQEMIGCSQCGRRYSISEHDLAYRAGQDRRCSRCQQAGFTWHEDQEDHQGDQTHG